jgi:glycosyltransferase involved in cell wall biosynthesis
MRVYLCSSYDVSGGAGRATYRLHQAFKKMKEIDSTLFVQQQEIHNDPSIKRYLTPHTNLLRKVACRSVPQMETIFRKLFTSTKEGSHSLPFLPDFQNPNVRHLNQHADIINLHWIGSGFLNVWSLASLKKPVVWTLHDTWPFCGTEHYPEGTEYYKDGYKSADQKQYRLSQEVWSLKHKNFKKMKDLTIVSPSKWLADLAQDSLMFKKRRVEVIPNSVDTETFFPCRQAIAREALGLDLKKKIILFGSAAGIKDKRKGFHHLLEVLRLIKEDNLFDVKKLMLLTFGSVKEEFKDFPVLIHGLGDVKDDRILRLAYSASDVLALPSEEDNLPNILLESMACGTPAVGFNIGGVPDIVLPDQTGFLAEFGNYRQFADGLIGSLTKKDKDQWTNQTVKFIENGYTLAHQGKAYYDLFADIVKNKK